MSARNRGLLAWALAVSLGALAHASDEAAGSARPLSEPQQRWLEEVDVILSAEELAAFSKLGRAYQRDAFIERFWRERDDENHTGGNEFRERWRSKVESARQLFGGPLEVRARHWLLHGPPDERVLIRCRRHQPQIEVWLFKAGSEIEPRPFPLIFYRPYGATGFFRLSEPSATVDGGPDGACAPDDLGIDEQEALRSAAKLLKNFTSIQYTELLERARERPPSPDPEWVATFESLSTDLPAAAPPLAAALAVEIGGRRQSRQLVEGTVSVAAPTRNAERHFLLNGEVVLDERLFESFRVRYTVPASADPVPLGFVRALRPGRYTLVVRVEEPASGQVFRAEQMVLVPAATDPDQAATGSEGPGDQDQVAWLHLSAPTGPVQGAVRFTAEVEGAAVAAVEFRVDGKPVLLKRQFPWSVEIDLGSAARPRRIEAIGLDGAGREILRDERLVNAGDYRFEVRLFDPQLTSAGGSVRVRAEVSVPAGTTVERLEIHLDDRQVATLHEAPWELPIAVPDDGALRVLRAVAVLANGSSAEDTALLNAPQTAAAIEVRLVELFVRATGAAGAPVRGLGCADFAVLENGVEQRLLRCEEAADRTLHLVVLLDVSASMADRLADARRAVAGFFDEVLQPRDRAMLMAFNDHPYRMVPFTSDFASLRSGLEGLKAERGTALWDGVIRGLQDLGGVGGRRVLLLVSDGEDHASSATFADAEALARQSGVTVYAIGIDQPFGSSRRRLQRLAGQTGGHAYFLRNSSELDGAYAQIAEALRAQYLLAFQAESSGEQFRPIAVVARRPGVTVDAPAGYLP